MDFSGQNNNPLVFDTSANRREENQFEVRTRHFTRLGQGSAQRIRCSTICVVLASRHVLLRPSAPACACCWDRAHGGVH